MSIEQPTAESQKNWILKALAVTMIASGVLGGVVGGGIEYMLGSNLLEVTVTEGELLAWLVFAYGFIKLAGRDTVQYLDEVMNSAE